MKTLTPFGRGILNLVETARAQGIQDVDDARRAQQSKAFDEKIARDLPLYTDDELKRLIYAAKRELKRRISPKKAAHRPRVDEHRIGMTVGLHHQFTRAGLTSAQADEAIAILLRRGSVRLVQRDRARYARQKAKTK